MALLSGSALCELHARVAATTGAEATGLGSHISRGLNALDLLDEAETGAGPGSSAVGGEGDWRWIVDGCEQLQKLRSGALEDAFKSDIEEAFSRGPRLSGRPLPRAPLVTCPGTGSRPRRT